MKLLTAELRRKLPPLYATEHTSDPLAIVKLFLPGSRWTWYLTEFDGEDVMFGFVKSGLDVHYDEMGYVSLAELESLRTPVGLTVERDLAFEPTRLSVITATKEIV